MAGNQNSGRLGNAAKMEYEDIPEFTEKCPRDLSKGAKAHWRKYVKLLTERKIIQNKDAQALKRLCVLQDLWEHCAKYVSKHGFTVVEHTDRGAEVIRERIESKLMKQHQAAIKDLEAKFGLTPKAGEGIKGWQQKKKRTSIRDQY